MKEEFIDECKRLSRLSNLMHKHGAVVLMNGEIVGRGYNYYDKSHASMSIHSEASAIIDARKRISKKDFKKCTLLVVRTNNQNELRLSRPCIKCRELCEYYNLDRIIYST